VYFISYFKRRFIISLFLSEKFQNHWEFWKINDGKMFINPMSCFNLWDIPNNSQ
jgi:hypothetical protein